MSSLNKKQQRISGAHAVIFIDSMRSEFPSIESSYEAFNALCERPTLKDLFEYLEFEFADAEKKASNRSGRVEFLRNMLVGRDRLFDGYFGRRLLLYADWTASGRSVDLFDRFFRESVDPWYANSHTEDSNTGRYMTALVHEAEKFILEQYGVSSQTHACLAQGTGSSGPLNLIQQILGIHLPPKTKMQLCKYGLKGRIRKSVTYASYEEKSRAGKAGMSKRVKGMMKLTGIGADMTMKNMLCGTCVGKTKKMSTRSRGTTASTKASTKYYGPTPADDISDDKGSRLYSASKYNKGLGDDEDSDDFDEDGSYCWLLCSGAGKLNQISSVDSSCMYFFNCIVQSTTVLCLGKFACNGHYSL